MKMKLTRRQALFGLGVLVVLAGIAAIAVRFSPAQGDAA